ncbi:unnamed protein product, partial [Adineta steineri]
FIFKCLSFVDDKQYDLSVIIEADIPVVNKTDCIFAHRRNEHIGFSVLVKEDIVNERRSA